MRQSHVLLFLIGFFCLCCGKVSHRPIEADVPVPEQDTLRHITLLFAGDLMQHKPQVTAAATAGGYDYTECFRYMKPLIENGNVYIAQPPLFKVERDTKTKKYQKVRYAFSDEERDRYIEELREEDGKSFKLLVQRYKGLGEMDPEQLWETTMNPETRTILRVKMEDAVKADEIITILMGDKVMPRKEYIEKYARTVSNLDI